VRWQPLTRRCASPLIYIDKPAKVRFTGLLAHNTLPLAPHQHAHSLPDEVQRKRSAQLGGAPCQEDLATIGGQSMQNDGRGQSVAVHHAHAHPLQILPEDLAALVQRLALHNDRKRWIRYELSSRMGTGRAKSSLRENWGRC
jgi:hypothetical protein